MKKKSSQKKSAKLKLSVSAFAIMTYGTAITSAYGMLPAGTSAGPDDLTHVITVWNNVYTNPTFASGPTAFSNLNTYFPTSEVQPSGGAFIYNMPQLSLNPMIEEPAAAAVAATQESFVSAFNVMASSFTGVAPYTLSFGGAQRDSIAAVLSGVTQTSVSTALAIQTSYQLTTGGKWVVPSTAATLSAATSMGRYFAQEVIKGYLISKGWSVNGATWGAFAMAQVMGAALVPAIQYSVQYGVAPHFVQNTTQRRNLQTALLPLYQASVLAGYNIYWGTTALTRLANFNENTKYSGQVECLANQGSVNPTLSCDMPPSQSNSNAIVNYADEFYNRGFLIADFQNIDTNKYTFSWNKEGHLGIVSPNPSNSLATVPDPYPNSIANIQNLPPLQASNITPVTTAFMNIVNQCFGSESTGSPSYMSITCPSPTNPKFKYKMTLTPSNTGSSVTVNIQKIDVTNGNLIRSTLQLNTANMNTLFY